ncbi:MAG TPA: ABC transporter permease [Thermoanaerobaculia bacterium]|nr:ABC transporter permease [Thermoanaerobaculia bacterium]
MERGSQDHRTRLGVPRRLTVAAVACFAVGTASVAAMVTLIGSALVRPLPFPHAERLVRVWVSEPEAPRLELSYPVLERLSGVSAFEALEATARVRLLVTGEAGGRRVEGEGVTPGYFDLLGMRPAAGRLFTPEEYGPGHEGVVVVGEALARERFGSAAAALGGTLAAEGRDLAIVGVLPAGFTGTVEDDAGEIELWLPIDHYVSAERRARWDVGAIWALARMRAGTGRPQARAELDALAARLAREQPAAHQGRGLTVEPLGENWRAPIRRGSYLLLAAALGLLLVAAANVSALLLAASLARSRARAVQRALGAPTGRLLREAFREALVVAAAGGALGALLGQGLLPWLLRRGAVALPDYVSVRPDLLVVAGVAGALGLAALLASMAPAAVALRSDPAAALRGGSHGGTGSGAARRTWSVLLAGQVAVALTLTFGALLLVRSYRALSAENLGFRTEDVVRLALFPAVFPMMGDETGEARLAAFERARERVAAHPGVEAVGLVWPTVPIWGAIEEPVRWRGMPEPLRERGVRAGLFAVDSGLLPALEIPILAGRGFHSGDGAGGEDAPVAVVSRALAEPLGGLEVALGREIALGETALRVVGVAEDARLSGARDPSESNRLTVYLPLARVRPSYATVIAATAAPAEALVAPLERRVGEAVPEAALDWVGTLRYWLGERYADQRFAPLVLSLFAGASLWITGGGVFALVAAAVERRRREIGIRRALGASGARVSALALLQGIRPVAAGAAVGTAGMWWAAELLGGLLHAVAPWDPWSMAAAVAAVLAVAVAASGLPARQATRVDPMSCLRAE